MTREADAGGDRAVEENLDPQIARTLLANERTYLAWVRTALALVAAGVAVSKLLPNIEIAGGRRVLGGAIVALGALVGGLSYVRWHKNEELIRRGRSLVHDHTPHLMAGIVAVAVAVGFVTAVLAQR